MSKILGAWVVAVLVAAFPGGVPAKDPARIDITGFTAKPVVVVGRSGGPRDAAEVYGEPCLGDIAESPNHVIHVTAPVVLTASVESGVDTTLVLAGEGAIHCDDDGNARSPLDAEVHARLVPGRYALFVGHMVDPAPYRLVLKAAPMAPEGEDVGEGLDFTIGPGFSPDPLRSRGRAGGDRDASVLGEHCSGTIGQRPQHRLTVTGELDLRIAVDSEFGASLAIVGEGRVLCDDDGRGELDPEIRARLAPGRYEVFVGADMAEGDYTLTLSGQR
jgi:hypothetical protein